LFPIFLYPRSTWFTHEQDLVCFVPCCLQCLEQC
jgi:hypothetical protein